MLCARLVNQVSGLDPALRVIDRACRLVSTNDSLSSVFQLGAELLGRAGKLDEAVALVKDGIKAVPPEKSQWPGKSSGGRWPTSSPSTST